jgi:ankyrin repeat/BTB/POZ domain-containing protein 2
MPRWPSMVSLASTEESGSQQSVHHSVQHAVGKTLEQCLLTTCVGSATELSELLARVSQHVTRSSGRVPPIWSPSALHALFYFMRCSQVSPFYYFIVSYNSNNIVTLTLSMNY